MLALVAGGLASGCATVGPNYKPATTPSPTNWLAFEDPRLEDSSPIVPLWWKQAFRDPVLDRLVDEALAGNLTLRSAALRVLQAHQQLLIVKGLRLPQEQVPGRERKRRGPGSQRRGRRELQHQLHTQLGGRRVGPDPPTGRVGIGGVRSPHCRATTV